MQELGQPLGSGSGANAGGRQSQVSEQLLVLEKSVNVLSGQIEALSNRLAAVLRNPEPTPENTTGIPDNNLVPIAAAIRENRYYLEGSISRLSDIIDRIEI